VAEQWLLLHPSVPIPDFSQSSLFEPIDEKTYLKLFLSDNLTARTFCRFHDSPHLNQIQLDLWERINRSTHYLLSLNNIFSGYKAACLDQISRAMKTSKIEVEVDNPAADQYRNTPCKGTMPRTTCTSTYTHKAVN